MLTTLKDEIVQDSQYRKFIAVLNLSKEKTNVNAIMDEIRDIAEIRTKTCVMFNDASLLKNLLEENLRAQAYRSRLAEMCIQLTKQISKLNVACDRLKDYIHMHYAEQIKTLGRTKDERNVLVVSILQSAYGYINLQKSAIQMAETVIVDIDKQHYSLKLTLDALNLHVNKERIL